MTRKKKSKQAPSETYGARAARGKVFVSGWVSADAAQMLAHWCKATGVSKTELLERALLHLPAQLGAPSPTPAHWPAVPPPAPTERRTAEPHRGSPGALAKDVLAKGRRSAVVVASGEVVKDGRVVR